MRALMPVAMVLIAGCVERASCEQVAEAAAVRTWECTGLSDLGYGVAKRMRTELQCSSGMEHDEKVVSGGCLAEIEELGCAQVEAHVDDVDWWMEAAPGCDEAFSDPR